MTEYWAMVAILLAVASVFVLWAVLRPVPDSLQQTTNHQTDNVRLFEQRQQELQAELGAGNLTKSECEAQIAELERTLYEDLQSQVALPKFSNRGGYLLLASALLIPAAGWFTYLELGASSGMQQRENMQATRALMQSAETMEQMLVDLEAHLQGNSNNPEGWFILANSYMQNGQSQQGLAAFEQALQYAPLGSPQRAAILGQYAQALFYIDGDFSERVNNAIAVAMTANPEDVSALSLLGIQAFETENFEAAIEFWQKALVGAGNSGGVQSLQAGIANARQQLRAQQGEDAQDVVINVEVRLVNGLQVPSNEEAVLFVYAREAGQRMPLLATKLDPRSLPIKLRLTNAMALLPNIDLANYAQLDIVAHIAKSGQPGQQGGDLVGQVTGVSVVAKEVVDLAIDRILPSQ
ncbi:MAG: c-type cytochrome biogenesis protein CcmI [Gammaproteobacteria bacterium]|nr:c-type cytochrome biogenesis protein CcmI [Gammaproteobacteria bacterium]